MHSAGAASGAASGCRIRRGLRAHACHARSPLLADSPSLRLAQRAERCAELGGEELRLFPRRKVPALGDRVVIYEVGICALGPAARGLILLARKDAHGHRNGDALGVEKATPIFPIETRCP